MKFLTEFKDYFCRMGIFVYNRSAPSFVATKFYHEKIYQIGINIYVYGLFLNMFLSTTWFLVSGGKTFQQYADCFFYWISATVFPVWHTNLLRGSQEYTDLFVEFETIMDKSKFILWDSTKYVQDVNKILNISRFKLNGTCKIGGVNPVLHAIYQQIDQKLEQLFKTSYFLLMKVAAPIFTVFVAAISVFRYFYFGHPAHLLEKIYPAM